MELSRCMTMLKMNTTWCFDGLWPDTRVVSCPMQPTGAFAPPTLGLGAMLRCKPLNRLAWAFVGAFMGSVYQPIIAAICRRHGLRNDAACAGPQVRE